MAELTRLLPLMLFSFFMLFTLKDLFSSQSNAEVNNKEIPLTNLGAAKYMGPTLRILYCYSCGYRNAFEQYSELIRQKYPDLIVEGGNYPPPGYNSILARILTITKMVVILCIVSGVNISQYIGQVPPAWWSWCVNNKIYSCMMIFFLCNTIEGQLISTGAFEISLNDVPVWSKLETGRIPQPPELFQIIENHMQFQDQTINYTPPISH